MEISGRVNVVLTFATRPEPPIRQMGGPGVLQLYCQSKEFSSGSKGGECKVIDVNQALCAGCGVCVSECPNGALALDPNSGKALVDVALCAGHQVCVEMCPNGALTWVAAPTTALVVTESPIEVIPIETRTPLPWRRVALPLVGGALSWVGRELMPRLMPLALDALDVSLARRRSERKSVSEPMSSRDNLQGQRQRRRRRRGR